MESNVNKHEWSESIIIKINQYLEISIFKSETSSSSSCMKIRNLSTECEVLLREYEFAGVCREMKHFVQFDIRHPSFWENKCIGYEYAITVEYNEKSFGHFSIKNKNGNSITLDYDSVCSIIYFDNEGLFNFD